MSAVVGVWWQEAADLLASSCGSGVNYCLLGYYSVAYVSVLLPSSLLVWQLDIVPGTSGHLRQRGSSLNRILNHPVVDSATLCL